MIIRDNTDPKVEAYKRRFGIFGDVYVVSGHFIESLNSHRQLIPNSAASTIEEAEIERVAYEAELARVRAEQIANANEPEITASLS